MKLVLYLLIFVMPLYLFCIDINYKRVSASNNEIHAFSKNGIIVAGENGKLIKTSNGGATWKWIETNCRNSFRHMNFNSKGLGVLSSNYDVLKSDDYGESWIYLKKSNTGDISKAFLDENGNVLIAKINFK